MKLPRIQFALLTAALLTASSYAMSGSNNINQVDANKLAQFTGTGVTNPVDIPYSATVNIDPVAGMYQRITTNQTVGAATVNTYSSGKFGQILWVEIVNPAGGASTITWGSNFENVASTPGTAGQSTLLEFASNGVLWRQVSGGSGGGGGGTPGGVNGDLQYNNAGSFGGLTPGAGVVNVITTPNSANLRTAITDETGSGFAVFSGSPTLAAFTATGSNLMTSDTLPLLLGSGNASTINDGGVVLSRSITGATSANAHGFSDASTVNRSTGIGYASFDANTVITGSASYDHNVGLQARQTYSSAGTITNFYGGYVALRANAGTISNLYGLKVDVPVTAGATVTNAYGLYVSGYGGANTLNYGLYVAGDPSFFGAAITENAAGRSSVTAAYFTVSSQGDTGITANTESRGVIFSGGTRTWADGTTSIQREYAFSAPTYNKTTSAATFTTAATVAINGAPVAGGGVTITNPYALWVQGGNAQFDGGITTTTINGLSPVTLSGRNIFQPAAITSGSTPYLQVTTPADTGLTAATESNGVVFNSGTRTWADGTTTTQREFVFKAPTYNKTTTSAAFTTAATLTVNSAPIAGSGVTITNPYAFWVQSNTSQFDGPLSVAGIPTFAATARSGSTAPYFNITVPTDTAITASSEAIGLATATATRTWATTGTVGLQRENYFRGVTYASASASQTFTDATTMFITAPIAGTNAIITRGHSLVLNDATSAASSITGGLVVATTLGTAATSVGIGGGNVNAGGTITAGSSLVATGGGIVTLSPSGGAVTIAPTGSNNVSLSPTTGSVVMSPGAQIVMSPTARTSGASAYVQFTMPADTGITASTEGPGFRSVSATRTWATTGTVTLQRENLFVAPTYASASASQTFTTAATVDIAGAPIQGSNAIITKGLALNVESGNSEFNGAVVSRNATAGIGYSTGAGGAVTQATNRTTAVTLNTISGSITTNTTSLAALGVATFTVNDTALAIGDTIVLTPRSGQTTPSTTFIYVTGKTAGTFNITINNTNTVTAEVGAIIIDFAIIKTVSS